jgi:3-hydroxyacyl-[acyl-carrier-protein] dehydratase
LSKIEEKQNIISMNIQEIENLLPHRYPFLMIDRVEEIEAGIRANGYKNITMNEPYFIGHFPRIPIMPGVLQVEAAAQLSCMVMLQLPEYRRGYIGMFTGMDNIKFRRKVIPGDRLDIEVELKKFKYPFGKFDFKATVAGEPTVSGEISFAMAKKEDMEKAI